MGCGIGINLSRGKSPAVAPNPDPMRFEIIKAEKVGKHVIAELHYPGCTTYEGRKLIMFEQITLKAVQALTKIDPHFTHEGKVFARFRPTPAGWKAARSLATLLHPGY